MGQDGNILKIIKVRIVWPEGVAEQVSLGPYLLYERAGPKHVEGCSWGMLGWSVRGVRVRGEAAVGAVTRQTWPP